MQRQRTEIFARQLRDRGWTADRNLAIEYRWAELSDIRLTGIVAEFVQLKVDIIVTTGTAASAAAKQATSTIPIVFVAASDPVGTGLVASLARPGSNVTGVSQQTTDAAGKRIEQLRDILPTLRRMAILVNASNPAVTLEITEAQAAARTLGVETVIVEIRKPEDIGPAFETLAGRADALFVPSDPLFFTNQIRINTLALSARLPTTFGERGWVESAGLMSYGPDLQDQYRRAADYVDKILRGAKPADLPVEQPTKFNLVVNLTTAKALGLTIPEAFLVRADEVIE
jgi:putative ABC transport system substrate-binding protein